MKRKRQILICLLLSFCFVLCACGTTNDTNTEEEIVDKMKEFTLSDGSASIYFNKDWVETDTGLVNLVMVSDKGQEEIAAMIFQFPKNSAFQVDSVEDAKELIKTSYQISEEEEIEAFEIPGMSNVCAISGKMAVEHFNSSGMLVRVTKGEACFAYGETDYAFYAIGYMNCTSNTEKEDMLPYLEVSCSKFKEFEDVVEKNKNAVDTVELTDTVRWFNASYAVLTELNGLDYNIFAGLPISESAKGAAELSLETWWGITDRTSADEMIDSLLEEGHRASFREYISYLKENGIEEAFNEVAFMLELFDIRTEKALLYVSWYEMYEQYGETAIDAWDYCRILNLLSYYYLAGYYTAEEALDKSLEIAQMIQPLFDSWDDLVQSWLRGYEYWAEESSEERQAIYEEIKARSDNPYQIDFKMKLEKTW